MSRYVERRTGDWEQCYLLNPGGHEYFSRIRPNGTLVFQSKSNEYFHRMSAMDSPKETETPIWIRNPDLDFDQRNVPLVHRYVTEVLRYYEP